MTWRSIQISVRSTQISELWSTVLRGLLNFCVCDDQKLICVEFSKIYRDLSDAQTLKIVLGMLQCSHKQA